MRKEIEMPYTILGDVRVTEEMFSWFNLLTKNEEQRVSEFALLNDECNTTPSTIIRYRGQMLKKQPKNLKIVDGTPEKIAKQLEEMFLEPISIGYVHQIQRVMKMNGWTWKDVEEAHYQDREKRIWRIISCSIKPYLM